MRFGWRLVCLIGIAIGARPTPGFAQADIRRRLAELTRRVAALEHGAQPASATRMPVTVRAPFIVVDSAGKPLFEVDDSAAVRAFRLYDATGHIDVLGSALPAGGFFKALNSDDSRVAVLGTGKGLAQMTLRDGPEPNTSRATLAVTPDGNSALVIMNQKHINVATLSHTPSAQAGILQLSNPAGALRLEAGTTGKDVGALFAGPGTSCVGGTLTPPSCVKGEK